MRLKAHAKINWALNVLGRQADGYHALEMLVQRLELADSLTFEKSGQISLVLSTAAEVPAEQNNLVIKAAAALKDATGYALGAKITLDKQIPVKAGLGGGSADAAATLTGLNTLWDTGLSLGELSRIGARLGADVPLCLYPGLLKAKGIGEVITPVPGGRVFHLLILQPRQGLSTAEVFLQYDRSPDRQKVDIQEAQTALLNADLHLLRHTCHNQLQSSAVYLLSDVQTVLDRLKGSGAVFAQMSGSGSAVFGVFNSEDEALQAKAKLLPEWPVCVYTRTLSE